MTKIVITGCAGFIGSHLVKSLVRNGSNEVLGIDNLAPAYGGDLSSRRLASIPAAPNFIFQNLDLTIAKPEELSTLLLGADVVIHLAAWAGVRGSQIYPHQYAKANLNAFVNVLESIRISKPELFLFASSSSVYGDLGVRGPVKESEATGKNLKSFYAATKWANEILAESHSVITGIPTVALRFFTVYGEFGRPDMAYWTFLNQLLSNQRIELYGETGGSRNFTYVSDAVQIVEEIISRKIHGFVPLNIASGNPIRTIDLVNTLAEIANRNPMISVVERPGVDVEKTWADLSNISKLIGESVATPVKTGLKNFYRWYTEEENR